MPKARKRGVNFLSLPLQRRMLSQSNYLLLSAEDTRTVRECLKLLSDRQRDMLESVSNVNDGEPVTRSELAEEWGARRLLDYHIRLLAHLVDRGLVLEVKSGRAYQYRVLPGVRAVLQEYLKSEREAAALRRQRNVVSNMPAPGDNKLYQIGDKIYRNTSEGMVFIRSA